MDNNLIDIVEGALEADTQDVLPNPITYQYYKQLGKRRIILDDEIDKDVLEKVILPYMDMCEENPNAPIEIIVNTIGGELYSGMSIVDVLDATNTPTTIVIMNMAASMGLYISMAGKNNPKVKTICRKHSVGLLHSGFMFMEGSAHSVRDTFNFNQRYEEKIKDYILSHSKITDEIYQKYERTECWMDAEDMLRFGIVDEIIE